ncbi:MAG: hypothetical protein AAB495_00610 [Patescibacteria group bacterium]
MGLSHVAFVACVIRALAFFFFDVEVAMISRRFIGKDGTSEGYVVLTTPPGKLLQDVQGANQKTLLMLLAVVIALVIPMYRLTAFLFG